MGREGAGIIQEVGEGVTGFQLGDRVAYPEYSISLFILSSKQL
jgi:NADPH:quinone reductase-like Zn-dependent oxidoreductase